MALDERAFHACYLRIERPLFNILFRFVWNAQDAQELLHDAFERVWAQRQRVDSATVDAYVYAAALNLARNRSRWRRLWQWVGLDAVPEDGDWPEDLAERSQEQARVRHALDRLGFDARQIILLSEFAGMDTARIAAVLRIAPGTVGSRKHRAMLRLKALLGEAKGAAHVGRENEHA